MPNLILDSLEIREFRAFKHLEIERLGRVNLIVGKNNVGKSSVLEALRLYAQRGSLSIIRTILREREEEQVNLKNTTVIENIEYLFHGRGEKSTDVPQIEIKVNDNPDQYLVIKLVGTKQLSFLDTSDLEEDSIYSDGLRTNTDLSVRFGLDEPIIYPLREKNAELLARKIVPNLPLFAAMYIPLSGLTRTQAARMWDHVSLTDDEPMVISSLQIIAPEVERLSFLSENPRSRQPIPVVRISNSSSRVPLGSLGEGMNRMFGIALALVNARDGILLVDEIESGLHYSVQVDMWRLVFETARRLNIQMFATTHSWDCIQGFQQAAQEDEQSAGFLVRLGRKQGNIVATVYNEEELAIVTREQIEVR